MEGIRMRAPRFPLAVFWEVRKDPMATRTQCLQRAIAITVALGEDGVEGQLRQPIGTEVDITSGIVIGK